MLWELAQWARGHEKCCQMPFYIAGVNSVLFYKNDFMRLSVDVHQK